ncbi:low-density lipoprotein receptor-related protein 1B-like isoform X2 [Ornithodoros turicata]|uniref:low-density lipoprotein receptor-related protein 1B-like isoform X2 n=1 Tax=Ornithodoros turicata TaxID=34597 RepID=UPI0031392C29
MVGRDRAGSLSDPAPEPNQDAPESRRPEESSPKKGGISMTVVIGIVCCVGLVVFLVFAYLRAFQKPGSAAPMSNPLQKGIGRAAKGIGVENSKTISIKAATTTTTTTPTKQMKTSALATKTTQGLKGFRPLRKDTTAKPFTKGTWKPLQRSNATEAKEEDKKRVSDLVDLVHIAHGCKKPDVLCADGKTCIRANLLCDGHPDCPNKSDEQNCVKLQCRPGLFKCHVDSHERCIRSTRVCDGFADCDDRSDESHCSLSTSSKKPDFFEDVPLDLGGRGNPPRDLPHEPNAGTKRVGPPERPSHISRPPPPVTSTVVPGRVFSSFQPPVGKTSRKTPSPDEECMDTEFGCKTTRTCIPSQWRCDGTADCEDGSDEVNCTKRICLEPYVSCGDQNGCVLKKKLCDGKYDCADKSDEGNCARCMAPLIKCTTVNRCIEKSAVCNGVAECEDHSDEENCKSRKSLLSGDKEGESEDCRSREFACKSSHECIPMRWLCDGSEDCEDGSDEEMCPRSSHRLASLRRKNENGNSIPLQRKKQPALFHNAPMHMPRNAGKGPGNNAEQSSDEDEDDDEKFHEESDEETGKNAKKYRDPAGNMDDDDDPEYHLDDKAKAEGAPKFKAVTYRPVPCKKDQFRCVDNSECISLSWKCDGNEDCSDGSDERKCRKVCEPAEFYTTCGDGVTCIPKNAVCDGVVDCKDGHDEANCSKAVTSPSLNALKGHTAFEEERLKFPDCPTDYFKCKSGGNCIMNILVCDDEEDCKDGSDEQNCAKQCPKTHFQCETDKTCIKRIFRCDGDVDCEDASDEKGCE